MGLWTPLVSAVSPHSVKYLFSLAMRMILLPELVIAVRCFGPCITFRNFFYKNPPFPQLDFHEFYLSIVSLKFPMSLILDDSNYTMLVALVRPFLILLLTIILKMFMKTK